MVAGAGFDSGGDFALGLEHCSVTVHTAGTRTFRTDSMERCVMIIFSSNKIATDVR